MKIRLFRPQGLKSQLTRERTQDVILHGHNAISPNNAQIQLEADAPLSSFWVGAKYRSRACAFYVLIIREDESDLDALGLAGTQQELLDAIPEQHRPAFAVDVQEEARD